MSDKTNEHQLLRDPGIEPTSQVIAEALGTANEAYSKFIGELANHEIDLEWRYYTDGKAWLGKGLYRWTGARGGQKEVTAFWLSIWEDPSRGGRLFKVTIFVPEKVRAAVLNLPLGDGIKQMIADAKQIGKLKFFPVVFDFRSDELFDAVYTLIDFRKMIK